MVQNFGAVVGEAYVVERDIAADAADIDCVRGIDDLGLGAHDLKEALEAGGALHVDLGKLREPAHWIDECRNVQRESYEVYVAEAVVHDKHSADGNDHDGHDTGRELHAAHERAHGFVVFLFRTAVHVVCRVEFLLFKLLVGKCLCRAHAGNAVFKRGVDDAHLALDLHVRVLHLHAAFEREPQAQRQQHRKHKRQLPVYREHDDHRTDNCQRADDYILRAVVCKLGNLEQIAGEPAHECAGAVFVVKSEGQRLHVTVQILAHARLDIDAHAVAEDGDDIVQHRLEHIRRRKDSHDDEKRLVHALRQVGLHTAFRHIRKRKVDRRDQHRAYRIDDKQLFLAHYVCDEYFKRFFILKIHF